jgi:hypothetical protein
VETRGPQDGEGGAEALGESNVVRLPRDWLGPRDELVPFGISPQRAPAADLDPTLTLQPSDFWGEDSAAIQHALPAPGSPAGNELRLPRVLIRAALLVAATVVLAAIVGLGTIGFGLTGSSQPTSNGSSAFEFGSLAVLMPPLLAGEAAKTSSHRAVARLRVGSPDRHVSRARSAKVGSHTASPPRYVPVTPSSLAAQSSPATPSTTSVSTGTGGGSSVEGSSVGAAGGSSAGTGDEGSADLTTTTHHTAPAGPVGAGAPFGPGHLG